MEVKPMKTQKLVFAVLVVLFIVIVSSAVTTLSLSAIDVSAAEHDGNGKWEKVCCGTGCAGGTDYCLGNGTYICCK